MSSFSRLYKRYARRAGVPEHITAYCLRHAFVCELLEHGATEKEAADLVGHTSTRHISRWYGSTMPERIGYLKRALGKGKRV